MLLSGVVDSRAFLRSGGIAPGRVRGVKVPYDYEPVSSCAFSEFADEVIVVRELVSRWAVYVSHVEALVRLAVGYDFHYSVLNRGVFYPVFLGRNCLLEKYGGSCGYGEGVVSWKPNFFGVGLLEGDDVWLICL